MREPPTGTVWHSKAPAKLSIPKSTKNWALSKSSFAIGRYRLPGQIEGRATLKYRHPRLASTTEASVSRPNPLLTESRERETFRAKTSSQRLLPSRGLT